MALGFPAYHTRRIPTAFADPRVAVRRALGSLGWTIRSECSDAILAATSVNLSSWGERIHIQFGSSGELVMTSKCSLPTQCIDWGKNKRNVRRFIEALQHQGQP